MHSLRRRLLIIVVALLVASGVSACSFARTAPAELLAKQDHVALAAWYEQEAARLREKATEMDQMVEVYQRDPERAKQMRTHGSPKVDFVQQCHVLAAGIERERWTLRPWLKLIAGYARDARSQEACSTSVSRKAAETNWVRHD